MDINEEIEKEDDFCYDTWLREYREDVGTYSKSYGKPMPLKLRIQRFIEVHKDRYDYSLIPDGCNSKTKVRIICPIHGIFEKRIDRHQEGYGCNKCSIRTEQNVLYVWRDNYTGLFKIGITHLKYKNRRITKVAREQGMDPEIWVYHECQNPRSIETELGRVLNRFRNELPYGDGRTEFFKVPVKELGDALGPYNIKI